MGEYSAPASTDVSHPAHGQYLVYGGSTAVGLFAVQLLKLIGYKVVAVAGARNHELVRSMGADEVVDYKDPEATIQKILEITKGGVDIGLDTISEGKSYEISVKCFKEGGGRLNAILWPTEDDKKIRPDVEIVSTLMYTLFGKVSSSRHFRDTRVTLLTCSRSRRLVSRTTRSRRTTSSARSVQRGRPS